MVRMDWSFFGWSFGAFACLAFKRFLNPSLLLYRYYNNDANLSAILLSSQHKNVDGASADTHSHSLTLVHAECEFC